MKRLMMILECDHQLVADDYEEEGNALPSHEYCPGCGMTLRVVGSYLYQDDEL